MGSVVIDQLSHLQNNKELYSTKERFCDGEPEKWFHITGSEQSHSFIVLSILVVLLNWGFQVLVEWVSFNEVNLAI